MWDKGEKALIVGLIILSILLMILKTKCAEIFMMKQENSTISCQCQNCVKGGNQNDNS